MKLKDNMVSLSKKKELSPEEISQNIKEIEEYLANIPKELIAEYEKVTGKKYIKIFSKNRRDDNGRFQSNELIAYIKPENIIDLVLERFGHYETGTFKYKSRRNENSREHINDQSEVIREKQVGKEEISRYKRDICDIENDLRSKIRNRKIIDPIKEAIRKVLGKDKKEIITEKI